MTKRFNLTQISEIFISYNPGSGQSELSIRYIDDSKYSFKQQNFNVHDESDAIETLKEKLKGLGFNGTIEKYNFKKNVETNGWELSDVKLQEMKREASLSSIIKLEGLENNKGFEFTNLENLYKIKGSNILYKYEDKEFKRLFMVKRSGEVELYGEDDKHDFVSLLTYEDKDLVRFFVMKDSEGGIKYVAYDKERVKDFTINKNKSLLVNSNLKK